MYNEKIENLIKAALADGKLTEKEKQVLFKSAQDEGIDLNEFEMVLDARLVEFQKEKESKSAPKSDKYGSVRKCPACGAFVGSFKGICSECGFEFTEVDANFSSKKLYDTLSQVYDTQKKKEIIETFPLPNSKADILEFLTALKPRIVDLNSEFADAYYKKYAECIEKAKVSFGGDKQLQPFIDDFSQVKKEITRKKLLNFLKNKWKLVAVVIALVFVGISIITSFIEENRAAEKRETQKKNFAMHISNGDAESAKSILKEMDTYFYDGALDLIKLYVSKGDVYNAIEVYEKLTPYHCSNSYMDSEHFRHGSNKNYEIDATKLIRKELIKLGKFDLVWKYSEWEYDSENHTRNAKSYFQFMSDVIMSLCQANKKQEARKFVKDYYVWFVINVDSQKNDDSFIDEYKNYNSKTAQTKLLQIINNY